MSLVVVSDLRKVYAGSEAGVVALDGVSFAIERGEFVGIRGPSGCGKSTLLHILGAMDRPSAGSVRIDGQELAALGVDAMARFRRRKVGFVFQSFHLLPTLTVAENVMLPLTLDGWADRPAVERTAELLEGVGLASRGEHLPSQLSGGEMQRAAVARAVAARPGLLLADEPTGNLDPQSAGGVLDLLDAFHREGGTVLLVTHEEQAAARADRTILLEQGRVVAESSA